jgi:hypothetical protein
MNTSRYVAGIREHVTCESKPRPGESGFDTGAVHQTALARVHEDFARSVENAEGADHGFGAQTARRCVAPSALLPPLP